ncbi:hypothetical protein CDL15_Pgr010838 [Punica granatum]|uniref:Uncharacterized protein n=1 Tax=Punica granatum TaxID=22663 RepID=A0A218W6H6_PUNGR|nr:hypothetical protein CDL15_Pgr010838 [Punica granatum]PKI63803.1 hypothetical protein CRG98_015787 [Punica granatum]
MTRKVFDRWSDLLCELTVRGYDRSHCPNWDCRELVIDECGLSAGGRIRCPICKKSSRFNCASPLNNGDDHQCTDVFLPRT